MTRRQAHDGRAVIGGRGTAAAEAASHRGECHGSAALRRAVGCCAVGCCTSERRAPLPAVASCAGPHLDPQPRAVALGARLAVTGGGFADGCDDSGSVRSVPGCRDQQVRDSPARPAEDVPLVLLQAGRSWKLGTADAAVDSTVRWEIRLPTDVAPGPAVLGASSAETALVIGG